MTSRQPIPLVLAVLASLLAALVTVAPAAAGRVDEGDDVRRTGTCTGRGEASLRLRTDDGEIRIEVEIETDRPGSRWVVILLHERRIVFRGPLRARGDRVRLRRTVRDFYGSDAVIARATGPRGETCRVSATLTEGGSARRDLETQSTRS
jgi:hypothetical protein